MSIPDLNDNGYLPEGIHICSTEEIRNKFGRFQSSDRRIQLFKSLEGYVSELKLTSIGKYLIVDGSFTTGKDIPSDIDLLLVLKDDFNFKNTIPPFVYNVKSQKFLKKKYNFDFYFGFENDDSTNNMLELFSRVKDRPGLEKGYLKISL